MHSFNGNFPDRNEKPNKIRNDPMPEYLLTIRGSIKDLTTNQQKHLCIGPRRYVLTRLITIMNISGGTVTLQVIVSGKTNDIPRKYVLEEIVVLEISRNHRSKNQSWDVIGDSFMSLYNMHNLYTMQFLCYYAYT